MQALHNMLRPYVSSIHTPGHRVQGKGHLRGVVHALTHDQGSLRFRDLAGGRRSKPRAAAGARRAAAEVALAVGLTLAWLNLHG